MFNILLNAKDFGYNPAAVAQFMQDVQSHMPQRQKENISPTPETSSDNGPLAEHWMALTSRRIRRTEGRSAEEQAAHNLKAYKGYSDEDLVAVKNGTFVQKNVDTDEKSDTLPDQDSDNEIFSEADLF